MSEAALDARDPSALAGLSGAPLDFIKVAAAALMLGDHVNTVLLGGAEPTLWLTGRIAYPLFCLVVACHLARGVNTQRYLIALLLAAVPTQPIFTWAFGGSLGSVLLTLSMGVATALALGTLRPGARHLLFAVAALVAVAVPLQAKSGVDFGLAGIMLPAAMTAAFAYGRAYVPWAILFTVLLNATQPRPFSDPWWLGPATDGLAAVVGAGAVTVLALWALRGRPRFLPRYALYLFYPTHLAVLALVRSYWSM